MGFPEGRAGRGDQARTLDPLGLGLGWSWMPGAESGRAHICKRNVAIGGETVRPTKLLNQLEFRCDSGSPVQGELAPLFANPAPGKATPLARRVRYVAIVASDMTK